MSLVVSDSVYLPPQGIYFRLLNYHLQHVIASVSDNKAEPKILLVPCEEKNSNQLFTIIHGSESSPDPYVSGLILLRNRDNGYSPCLSDDRVENVFGGATANCWLRLEPGTGQFSKRFRVISPFSKTALACHNYITPNLRSAPLTSKWDNQLPIHQYFSFDFEEMEIIRVDYDLENGKIKDGPPKILAAQMLTNNTSAPQEMRVERNELETHSATWLYGSGFPLDESTSLQAYVPVIRNTKLLLALVSTESMKFGSPNFYNKPWTMSFSVKIDPAKTIRAASTATEVRIEVPYTILLRSKATKVEVTTNGLWIGESTSDPRHSISPM